jgi:hypothetical protein
VITQSTGKLYLPVNSLEAAQEWRLPLADWRIVVYIEALDMDGLLYDCRGASWQVLNLARQNNYSGESKK